MTPTLRRWLVASLALTLLGYATALAGCATARTGQPPGVDPAAGADDWSEPASYAFTLESACGERDLIGTFRVIVMDGKVTAAEGRDDSARRMLAAREPRTVPSLGDLLDQAGQARRDGADVVDTAFDPVDGHPTKITIDRVRQGIDDEECYTISDFVVTSASKTSG
jgi:hypothetical protein